MLAQQPPSRIHENEPERQRVALDPASNESSGQDSSGPTLEEVPFDILTEIFKHLEPVNLLMLLRTSRILRALLLNRPVASLVWKNVGFSA